MVMPAEYIGNEWNNAELIQIKRNDGLDPRHQQMNDSRKIQNRKKIVLEKFKKLEENISKKIQNW